MATMTFSPQLNVATQSGSISVRRAAAAVVVLAMGIAAFVWTAGWQAEPRAVVVVFAVAVGAWSLTKIDDTVVALAACCALVIAKAMTTDALFATLGDPTIWLLVGACMMAAGVTASGLAERVAVRVMAGATGVRSLAHRTTIALTLTSFAIPATSGRAALAIPVLRGVAAQLPPRVQRAMSLLFPSVILLSAFVSLLGAGAHLIAANLIEQLTGVGIGFWQWMILAAPVGIASAHLATEVILWVFLRRADRAVDIAAATQTLRTELEARRGQSMSVREHAILGILFGVVVAWSTEPWHGMDPAMVAVLGGVATVLPRIGTAKPKEALGAVPWSLLVFLAATLALGGALVSSGAAGMLAAAASAQLAHASGMIVVLVIVVASALAHLVIHSRSARATVLIPPILALALAGGVNPVTAALASTAAAGICMTLTASAKPVAMFAAVEGIQTYQPRHLLILSAVMTPLLIGIVLAAAVWWWPFLGFGLFTS